MKHYYKVDFVKKNRLLFEESTLCIAFVVLDFTSTSSNECDRDLTSRNWQCRAHNDLVTTTIGRERMASKQRYKRQYESTILESTDQNDAPKRLMRQLWQRSKLKKLTASSAQRSRDDHYWTRTDGVEATIRVTIWVNDTQGRLLVKSGWHQSNDTSDDTSQQYLSWQLKTMHQRGRCGNEPELSNKCDRDLTSRNWQHPAHNNLVTTTIGRERMASKRQYEWQYGHMVAEDGLLEHSKRRADCFKEQRVAKRWRTAEAWENGRGEETAADEWEN